MARTRSRIAHPPTDFVHPKPSSMAGSFHPACFSGPALRSAALLAVLLLSPLAMLHAQARPGCFVVPKSLSAMRGCYRPLLVFSPGPRDPRLRRQASLLDQAADDMMDRFVLFTPVVSDEKAATTPLDAPWTLLPAEQVAGLRARFHVPADAFAAILLDEDGQVLLRSSAPVDVDRLNAIIDRLPRRQAEKLRPNAN